jgi:hypothetical protein
MFVLLHFDPFEETWVKVPSCPKFYSVSLAKEWLEMQIEEGELMFALGTEFYVARCLSKAEAKRRLMRINTLPRIKLVQITA